MPSTFSKVRNKPSARRSRWFAPAAAPYDLKYLGWGSRFYGVKPTPCKPSHGWSYEAVKSGSPTLLLDGDTVQTKVGDLFIFDLACAHGWRDRPERRTEMLVWIWKSAPRSASCRPSPGGFVRHALNAATLRQIERIHAASRQEVSYPDDCTPLALERLHLELDILLGRNQQLKSRARSASEQLALAIGWMRENLSARRPVTTLCDYLQMSSGAVEHLFVEKLGKTPSSHFQRLKMERAAEMLKAGKTVKEVAYSLSYSHANDFSRAFKAYARTSPKATS
jgi:AraC-like DNA-binding protein